MKFRAIIFDLDGTLLDSLADLADSMNCVLEAAGLPTHNVEAYKRFVGDGMENLVRRALPHDRQDEADRALAAMRAEYGRRWRDKTRPYPGIPELLDALQERSLRLAILSNKPDDFTRLIVARLLPHWRIDAVMGLRPGWPRKPDPAGALAIARDLGLPPAAFLYVGDTDTDMRTAKAAGMFAVGVLWGFRTKEELCAHGAAALIEHPLELLELL